MTNKHRVSVVNQAIRRLREIAHKATVRDASGKVLFEGHPSPGNIADELQWVYIQARKKAKREAQ